MFRVSDFQALRRAFYHRTMQGNWLVSTMQTVCLFFLLCLPLSAASQNDSRPTSPAVPTELTALDPDIRALLNDANISCKPRIPNERVEEIQKALQIANDRGLIRDRAVVEAVLGAALAGEGKMEMAFHAYEKAFQDAMDSKNEILEADILNALASQAELKGNNQKALELLSRALTLSEKNASLYEKARALGAMGRLELLAGKTNEARNSIEEALSIDRLNGYRFEALHLVYRAYLLALAGKDDQAMDLLSQAKTEAIKARDAYAFLLANNAYALGQVKKGKADEAIGELELLRKGDLGKLALGPDEQDCLTSALTVPLVRISLLEGLSNVLEAANQKEKEIEIWRELLSTSHDVGFLAGEAEAEHKIAGLESQLAKSDDALNDYAAAADLYRKLQNEPLLAQVELSQALLLIKLGRGKEALLLEHEIASYAERHGLRGPEFTAYGVLAEIYQPGGNFEGARDALEKALSLVRPGPFDEELDNRSVLEDYLFLADDYKALKIPTKELIAIDNAFFVAVHLKDEQIRANLLAYLDKRIQDLEIRKVVTQRQKEGQLTESLVYSYILFIRDGSPSKPTDDQSNWQRILNLPLQITRQSGGAASLREILHDIGPMIGFNKLPVLSALARYYISDGADPFLAEKYALESESVLKDAQGDMTSLKAEPACILAVSYSRQNKNAIAKEKIEECTSLAKKMGDQQTIIYSDVANTIVQSQLGNIAAAKSSLENLIAKVPDNPELQVELAMSLAGIKLYDEANGRLDFARQKLISGGDEKAAAAAYISVARVLNADSSEKAQELQVQYLKSAWLLYHTLGARHEEAETLIVLGDYYLKMLQTKTALDNYEEALDLGQRAEYPDIAAEGQLGLGNGYKAQRDFNRAAECHLKAAIAYHKFTDASREALSLGDLASDYFLLGDTEKALSTLLEAKNVAKNAQAFNRYLVAYLIGDFYRSQGQFEKALASFDEAVEITTQVDLEHLGYSHIAIASLDSVIGNWDDAKNESEIALGLFEQIGQKEGQANCWAELTSIYCDRSSSLKDFDKAQQCYAKAKELGYGKILELDLMEIYLQTGKYAEAVQIALENFQSCQKSGTVDCQAHALISLSEAEGLKRDLINSRSALNRARPMVSQSPEIYLRGRFLYAEARLLVLEGKLYEALASYKQLISLIETVKGNLSAQEQKSISENYSYIYDQLVSLLYLMSGRTPGSQSKFASESFEYAEINKARQFATSWGRVFVNQMRLTLPPAIQEREQALNSQRDRLLAQLEASLNNAAPNERAERDRLEGDLSSVQRETAAFLDNLRKTAPQYAAIAYPEDIQLSALPLKKGETLVEFKMTDNSTYVWIIEDRDGSRNELAAFYEIPKDRGWFLDRLSRLRTGLNSGRPGTIDWKISEELYAELFPGQMGKMVADSQEIIFVPDDVLFVLPFELFSPEASKGKFIFLQKATTYYPSAISFRLARTASHQSNWQEAFLGIADPITSPEDERFEVVGALNSTVQDASNQSQSQEDAKRSPDPDRLKARGFLFERLPGTAVEVQSIASLLRARNETVDVRSGASATKSQLLDTDLSKFRFLHFATHGVLPVDTGIKEPSLVLSYDGVSPSHMFLSMSEIISLKLRSESVVLSACNTGSGKISRAEGVMSLGRAFLAAGASSVTVSLWQVSDASTAVLMKKYYEGLLEGKKKSDAMALARSAVYESGANDPLFWAPFIVIGE